MPQVKRLTVIPQVMMEVLSTMAVKLGLQHLILQPLCFHVCSLHHIAAKCTHVEFEGIEKNSDLAKYTYDEFDTMAH